MSPDHIHAIAHLRARLEEIEELKAMLTSLLEPTRQEPGCIRFVLTQSREAPAEFAVVSEWRNEQAVQDHVATSYAQAAMSRLPKLLAVPMDLRFYRLVG